MGERSNLIQYVIVDFEAPITTTLTNEELRLSFVLRVATSGRPLPISAAVIEDGTKVNLTLYHRDSKVETLDSQTDVIVNVAFESLLASVHDDDDGLTDRLRIHTSTSHFEFTSSAAFSTFSTMTLGAVTRVSATVSDIAVTDGALIDESVTVEYTAGNPIAARLRQRLSANGDGPLDGFEMGSVTTLDAIQVPIVTVTEGEDGMSYALAGGLIGGAAVLGLLLGYYSRCSLKTYTKAKHYRSRVADSDEDL